MKIRTIEPDPELGLLRLLPRRRCLVNIGSMEYQHDRSNWVPGWVSQQLPNRFLCIETDDGQRLTIHDQFVIL